MLHTDSDVSQQEAQMADMARKIELMKARLGASPARKGNEGRRPH